MRPDHVREHQRGERRRRLNYFTGSPALCRSVAFSAVAKLVNSASICTTSATLCLLKTRKLLLHKSVQLISFWFRQLSCQSLPEMRQHIQRRATSLIILQTILFKRDEEILLRSAKAAEAGYCGVSLSGQDESESRHFRRNKWRHVM